MREYVVECRITSLRACTVSAASAREALEKVRGAYSANEVEWDDESDVRVTPVRVTWNREAPRDP